MNKSKVSIIIFFSKDGKPANDLDFDVIQNGHQTEREFHDLKQWKKLLSNRK